MTLWRISNHATLDGGGGLRASSRWHTRGQRIVYCAPNPATALLEVLVHAEIDLEDLPLSYRYLEISLPDSVQVETLPTERLPRGWQADLAATRRIGDEWLQSNRSALLTVPCVLVPATSNFLLNPRHPDSAAIHIARLHDLSLDPRLDRR